MCFEIAKDRRVPSNTRAWKRVLIGENGDIVSWRSNDFYYKTGVVKAKPDDERRVHWLMSAMGWLKGLVSGGWADHRGKAAGGIYVFLNKKDAYQYSLSRPWNTRPCTSSIGWRNYSGRCPDWKQKWADVVIEVEVDPKHFIAKDACHGNMATYKQVTVPEQQPVVEFY